MLVISLSTENREGKYNPSYLRFERKELSQYDFLQKMREGYCFAPLFNKSKFYIKEKTQSNWIGTQTINLDIDYVDVNTFPTIQDYLNRIGDIKPSIVYPSFHHNREKGSQAPCIRFHLIYILDKVITSVEEYKRILGAVKASLPTKTDEQAEGYVQFNYGNYNFQEAYIFKVNGINDVVLSTDSLCNVKDDLDIIEYVSVLPSIVNKPRPNEYYENKESLKELEKKFGNDKYKNASLDYNLLFAIDVEKLSIKELYKNYSRSYSYIFRKENCNWVRFKNSSLTLQEVEEDEFFKLNWLPNEFVLQDGEQRRRFTFNRMCCVRLLKPEINVNELIYNYYIFITQHINNTDKVFTTKKIVDDCIQIIGYSYEDLKKRYNKVVTSFKNNDKLKCKTGVIACKGNKPSEVLKNWRKIVIEKTYNPNCTDEQNLVLFLNNVKDNTDLPEKIKKQMLTMSLRTFQTYKKELGFSSNENNKTKNLKSKAKHSDEELVEYLDFNLSVRENLKFLKLNGFSIGRTRLNKLFKQYA